MARDTSIVAYNEIKNNGLLSERRLQVYEALFHHGPLTAGETWSFHLPECQIDSVRPRMAELERLGVVKIVGERECRVTGNSCFVWDVTGNLPSELEKRKTAKEIIASLTEQLRRSEENYQQLAFFCESLISLMHKHQIKVPG